MKTGLSTQIKEEVWKLKSVDNKTYSEIMEIMGESGVSLTDNQIREVSREMRKGNRYGQNSKQIERIRTNTMSKREQLLTELESMKDMLNNPEMLKGKLEVIKQIVSLLDGMDKFDGKGTPHTQINILQVKARDEKFDKLFEWMLTKSGLNRGKLDEFETYIKDTEKIIDAKYEEIDE